VPGVIDRERGLVNRDVGVALRALGQPKTGWF